MKILKFILLAIVIFSASENLFATAQISDKLIYKGKEYSLQSLPLEKYFYRNPARKPLGETMTALWRGYRATFAITDGFLEVTDIEIIASPEEGFVSAMDKVFPGGPARAEWYTGVLAVPYGEVTGYEKDRFAAIYSNYMLIEVEKGKIGRVKKFTQKKYTRFLDMQFVKFRDSAEYSTAVADVRGKFSEADKDFTDLYIRQNITDYLPRIL